MTPFYRLHSGGVVRNGAAVLLVGPNGAGKTTLVLRLVHEGFSVLSDDEVWIDPASRLAHPTARPLLLKESAWDLFPHCRDKFIEVGEQGYRSWWLRPEDLRPSCKAEPTLVWGMVVLKPASGDRPSLEEIGQTEAISCLLPESMNFPDLRDIGLSALVNIVRSARLFSLTKGDLDESAQILSGVLP
jgi:GTPase SAR1 family protein